MVSDLDLITRDEFEVLKALMEKSLAENEALRKKIAKLEKDVKSLKKA